MLESQCSQLAHERTQVQGMATYLNGEAHRMHQVIQEMQSEIHDLKSVREALPVTAKTVPDGLVSWRQNWKDSMLKEGGTFLPMCLGSSAMR